METSLAANFDIVAAALTARSTLGMCGILVQPVSVDKHRVLLQSRGETAELIGEHESTCERLVAECFGARDD